MVSRYRLCRKTVWEWDLLVLWDMTDNMMIRSYKEGRGHFFADRQSPKKLAEDIVEKLEVATPSVNTPVSRLSGGNVQKVLVGREISADPTVLMVAYPVRGLDINSSLTIYDLLNEQKKRGVAVICVGEDLDVLLELCDKILVLCGGKITGVVDARKTTTKEKLGLMMTKVRRRNQRHEQVNIQFQKKNRWFISRKETGFLLEKHGESELLQY